MWTRLASSRRAIYHHKQTCRAPSARRGSDGHPPWRGLLTLAIETSCDDTSVAILETQNGQHNGPYAKLHFHEGITANNDAYGGIHPVIAQQSHQRCLAPLLQRAIPSLQGRKPDFIAVTRGPGMRANLAEGLATGKGLAVTWDVPLLGVHHMQAHALTPRLVDALSGPCSAMAPTFPFFTLLVSGGHTLLLSSDGLTDHAILAETADIALGDCLDKAARVILPQEALSTPFGAALERFAFPDGPSSYQYDPPRNRKEEISVLLGKWNWSLTPPLAQGRGGRSSTRMEYSFAGLTSAVERAARGAGEHVRSATDFGIEERRDLAREVQRVAFQHLCGRLLLHLKALPAEHMNRPRELVVSGGVAANKFLKHVLRAMLDAQGFSHIGVLFPPIEFCTDNAAMIAWAGCEMWEAGWRSDLSVEPIRKWSLDASAEDGGILGAPGWHRV